MSVRGIPLAFLAFAVPAAIVVAIAARRRFGMLMFRIQGDQWQFECGGVRECWFQQITLIGQFGQLDQHETPASYYIRFQNGTAAQVAEMMVAALCSISTWPFRSSGTACITAVQLNR